MNSEGTLIENIIYLLSLQIKMYGLINFNFLLHILVTNLIAGEEVSFHLYQSVDILFHVYDS